MSLIEAVSSLAVDESAAALAYALFDEVIAPAAAGIGAGYFPTASQPEQATYYVQPSAPQLMPEDFDFPGGGDADGLIDSLVEYWEEEGENLLATSGPRLKEIVAALRAESVESDGNVDPYCYTMF